MKESLKGKVEKILYYAIIPISIIGIMYILHKEPRKRLKEEPTCFAKTNHIVFSKDADGVPLIDYQFKVNNKNYEGSNILNDKNRDKIKDIMKVRYICDDPEINELVFDE